jgi:glycosyltransferase involved in cell wall biosynthesis
MSLLLLSYEKPLVVLVTSYNNERYVEKNLNSIYMQKYGNYHVIYVDDCSTDRTYERVLQWVHEHNQQSKITVIRNKERRNAMANFYTSIHACKDNEIIITLDGDDWFAHDEVLSYINEIYNDPHIWFTYGRYQIASDPELLDHNKDFPQHIIDSNAFRSFGDFPVSHLRTHYAWLFKLIKLEDFLYDDYFFPMTSDYAMLMPMIEMASEGHFLPVHEILYSYNNRNPINDCKVNVRLQRLLANMILHKQSYAPLHEPQSVETIEKNDHVSIIMLCSRHPSLTYLSYVRNQLMNAQAVYLLVPEKNINNPQDENVSCLAYGQDALLETLCACLATCESNYVLLCTDTEELVRNIDMQMCVKLLKETHTDIFYCALSYDNLKQKELLLRKQLPLISQEFPVYAWHASNRKGKWHATALHMTIWEKQELKRVLSTIDKANIDELKIVLDRYIQQSNKLGLMFRNVVHAPVKKSAKSKG